MGMISEDKLTNSFIEAFKETVEPGLNTLTEKVDDLATRMSAVENRLEKIDNRLERQGKVQDDLQERVETLESASL